MATTQQKFQAVFDALAIGDKACWLWLEKQFMVPAIMESDEIIVVRNKWDEERYTIEDWDLDDDEEIVDGPMHGFLYWLEAPGYTDRTEFYYAETMKEAVNGVLNDFGDSFWQLPEDEKNKWIKRAEEEA